MRSGMTKIDSKPSFGTKKKFVVLPVLAAAFAAAVFIADTLTNSEIAVAVLYVAVVLMSARFCGRRGVLIITGGCLILTVLSYLLTATGVKQVGLINTGISISAIGLTAHLALKIESARFTASALANAERLRDALLGSVSHELRTPLASILGGVSVLAETPSVTNDPRVASLAKDIRDEAVRLNSDIQNLLDAALITSDGLLSRRDWTDPTDILDAAVKRITLRQADRRFELSVVENPPLLEIDPVLVEQALSQIIANAVKFSALSSTITIAAGVENRSFVISVHDDGVGLTMDEKSKVTERFFRGPRHVGKIPGSGLGLWIADTFVKSSGGTLWAESAGEGQGTTIRIAFPIPTHSNVRESR